jgi:hypothetical protein
MHASFPWARTTITILVCHFCSGSLQPTPNLELLNYLKFWKCFASEEERVVARWQEILWSRENERSDDRFRFLCQGTGLDQTWAVLESLPGSQPSSHTGSHSENQLTWSIVKINLWLSHEQELVMRTGSLSSFSEIPDKFSQRTFIQFMVF